MTDKKINTPVSEADLTRESANAATEYVQKRFPDTDLAQRTLILNSVAHGFYMGYRKHEAETRENK